MPENAEGHFALPKLNDTRVGERLFFIHEHFWDGHPTLRQTIKTEASRCFGYARQRVLNESTDDHLGGNEFVALYRSARKAFDEYIAHARWLYKVNHFDPHRPGDQIAMASIDRNANALLRQNWKTAEQEARAKLDAWLQKIDFHDIPVQTHLIGDPMPTVEGAAVPLGGVELQREYDVEKGGSTPLHLVYRDEHGMPIQIASAS